MLRKTYFALGTVAVMAFLARASYGQQSLSLFDYLSRRAARLAAELPPLPDTVEAWEKQRSELVAQLTATLGLPERERMKAAVTCKEEADDLVIEEVAYLWAQPSYASATVIRSSRTDGRRPAVIIPSGWLGHYTFLPYRPFVDQLARQGCMVLFIDDPRTGKRQAPYAGLYATAAAAGTQVAGIQVFDALRGLDYLLTRPDVDPDKIGIAGLGEGALQAFLAAALEPRFQFVVAVGGPTTYESLVQAAAQGKGPEDPSVFVADLLTFADMDRVAACLAPRPVLVAGSAPAGGARGTLKVLRTMQAVYGLYEAPDRIQRMPGQSSDDTTPYLAEICRWIEVDVLPGLTGSDAAPRACGPPEDADFSMLGHMQRRIADRTASLPVETSSEADWQGFRDRVVQWLRESCALDRMRADPDQVVEVAEGEVLVTEQLALGLDADFRCPAVLIRPAAPDPARRAGVVLSHDDRQCAASAKIAEAARRLASNGYWVIVPDHASVEPQSRQTLADPERPRFYGDEAARFYGPADAVGLPPLALRVAENLAAFRYLAGRLEGDADKIVVAGLGTGGVDACLAAVLDERIAGVASVDATTVRDWSHNVAPGELRFFHIMPYLPSMCSLQARRPTADRPSGSSPSEHPEIPPAVDWDGFYAALAPRPLVIVRLKDGWPRSGCEQVAATASAIYQRQGAENALLALGPRDVTEELETNTPSGILKQLVAAARTLVPTPPQPGIVGSLDGLRSRRVVDTASGLIWIVAEMNGYDQEFAGSEYRLETWSFFNDNGGAQQGRRITPLVFKKEGDRYQLTGIGTTRTNAGTGVQTFEFEPVDGSALVGDGYFFGWHTGDREGHHNPGVAEFEDAPDSLMIILTADGQMGAQQLKIGASYRLQSQFRRRYSVMAVSKKP